MSKLQLPKSLLDLPEKDIKEITEVLLRASKLPKTKILPHRTNADEHNMWERNGDPMQAQAEDDLYQELIEPWTKAIANLFIALDLPFDKVDIKKSMTDEFLEFEKFEDELLKSKDSGRSKMSDLIKANRGKRQKIMKWIEDGKAMTRQQMKKIDDLLKEGLQDFNQKAEEFMTRAGFIGKFRNQIERENLDAVGYLVDRFPKTITASRKEGVVLTKRQQAKEAQKGNKVIVLPLTEREAEAVAHASNHAGDKITEVSDRHRAGIRQMVVQAKRERWSAQQLAQALFDKYGEHNRDWRRVAITELAFATSDAYLSGIEEGETVVGMGSPNACKRCKALVIGKSFTVTHKVPNKETYETDMKQMWVGKSNYGRKISEQRPCIPLHPNCRCRWHRISRFYKVDNNGNLVLKDTKELIQEERAKRGLPPDPNL